MKINLQKIFVVLIFAFYTSTNSFWGYQLFLENNLFAAAACVIPLVFFCIQRLLKRNRIETGLLFLIIALYLVIVISSTFNIKHILFYGLCAAMLLDVDISSERSLLGLFCGFAVLFAAGSLINYFLPDLYRSEILPSFTSSSQYSKLINWSQQTSGRIIPGFANQTSFNVCHFAYGIGYVLCKFSIRRKLHIWDWVLLILFFGCFIFCNKRASLLFLFLALALCYYFVSKDKEKGKRLMKLIVTGGAAALLVYFLVMNVDLGVFHKLRLTLQNIGDNKDITSGRGTLYTLAIRHFLAHPVFGIGWEKYRYLSEHSQPLNTHNIYLELLCETGIVGFSIFFYFFTKALRTAIRSAVAAQSNDLQLATRFCLFMQLYFLMDGLTANPLYDPPYYIPYFLICAYTFSLMRSIKRNPIHIMKLCVWKS